MKPMHTTAGVTLIELVVVIAITSIIAAAVALFIRRPVEGYADAARRAALTDEADTALRRITRDLRLALPNSVRVDGTGRFVEYIETTGGGRYRAEKDILDDDPLDFAAPDTTFNVIGPVSGLVAGSQIVVYNLYNNGTVSNAYSGDNRAAFSGFSTLTNTITIAPTLFPEPSPAKRFHVVSGPVTYGCTAGGQLLRYWGYAYNTAQVAPPTGGFTAVLAANVDTGAEGCRFVYTPGASGERTAVVSITLQINSIAAGGGIERVRLFQQAQVSNVP